MSRKSPLQKLLSLVGRKIRNVRVAIWLPEEDPLAIEIQVVEGPVFTLGCAGDGSVWVRLGRLAPTEDSGRVRYISRLAGETIQSVDVASDSVHLRTINHSLLIVNRDDELEIHVRGRAP